jgi:hypothetical protein
MGFVQAFVKGMGLMVNPLPTDPDPKTTLVAATAAWEDHLIRTRRAEAYAAKEGRIPP